MDEIYDVIIVGAGAAGLYCGVLCAQSGLKVLICDSQKKFGAKILMSGGTRCNLTNADVRPSDYHTTTPRHLARILNAYPPARVIAAFQSWGLNVRLEAGGRYFPEHNDAKRVLKLLIQQFEFYGGMIKSSCQIQSLLSESDAMVVETTAGESLLAKRVVVATGGLSYPSTGSKGDGYRWAQQFGHTCVARHAALTPLRLKSAAWWKALQGVKVDARIEVWRNNKRLAQQHYDLLWTHFGVSGFGVLNVSRHLSQSSEDTFIKTVLDLWPMALSESFEQEWLNFISRFPKRTLKRFLSQRWPERFIATWSEYCSVDTSQVLSQINKKNKKQIFTQIKTFALPVSRVYGYGKAEVTAGGVSLSELNVRTMASRFHDAVYFIGEVCDVDGRIGGFNFQWAWASAAVAAQALNREIGQQRIRRC